MPRKIQPYCAQIVQSVEDATIYSLGSIAAAIAKSPPESRLEAFTDAEVRLTEHFALLGRGSEFVSSWVAISMTALHLLVAASASPVIRL
jgi:hypothetical protein